jgi:hypothetical protein
MHLMKKLYEKTTDHLRPALILISLVTISDIIRATEDSLIVEPAAAKIPQTAEELDAYKKKVLGDHRLRGLIVAEDGKTAGIVIKINPYVDDKKAVSREIEAAASEFNGGPEQISTTEKRKADLPDDIFDPKNLKTFDPTKFGVK